MFRRSVFAMVAVAGLLALAACGGPRVHISDEGKVPGAGPDAELVRLINLQRREAGLPPLETDRRLQSAARDHAGAMAGSGCVDFDCGGRKTEARVAEAGYRARSSRFYISAGQALPEEMLRDMMGRDWGRSLILSESYRHVAVGYGASAGDYRHYWAVGFAAPAIEDQAALAAEVVRLVNIERAKHGAGPLVLNPLLNRSAQFHADYMAESDCFEHLCPGEQELGMRVREAGYDWRMVAENIAAGQEDAAEVVAGWMKSPGHRRNILNPGYREIGIGYTLLDRDGGKVRWRHYWVQNFGSRG